MEKAARISAVKQLVMHNECEPMPSQEPCSYAYLSLLAEEEWAQGRGPVLCSVAGLFVTVCDSASRQYLAQSAAVCGSISS